MLDGKYTLVKYLGSRPLLVEGRSPGGRQAAQVRRHEQDRGRWEAPPGALVESSAWPAEQPDTEAPVLGEGWGAVQYKGKGLLGVVWEAKDSKGSKVAVKVLYSVKVLHSGSKYGKYVTKKDAGEESVTVANNAWYAANGVREFSQECSYAKKVQDTPAEGCDAYKELFIKCHSFSANDLALDENGALRTWQGIREAARKDPFQTSEALVYLVLDLVDGEEVFQMRSWMQSGDIPGKKGMRMSAMIIRETAKGLKLLQKQGFVFGDLKDDNLMLIPTNAAKKNDPDGYTRGFLLRFVDMGSMTITKDTSKVVKGNHFGAPPEGLRPPFCREKWDHFSLGVLIMDCFLLRGRLPKVPTDLRQYWKVILRLNGTSGWDEWTSALADPGFIDFVDNVWFKLLESTFGKRLASFDEVIQNEWVNQGFKPEDTVEDVLSKLNA